MQHTVTSVSANVKSLYPEFCETAGRAGGFISFLAYHGELKIQGVLKPDGSLEVQHCWPGRPDDIIKFPSLDSYISFMGGCPR